MPKFLQVAIFSYEQFNLLYTSQGFICQQAQRLDNRGFIRGGSNMYVIILLFGQLLFVERQTANCATSALNKPPVSVKMLTYR